MSLHQFATICVLALVVAPIAMYLCVKFGVAGFYVGRRRAKQSFDGESDHGE